MPTATATADSSDTDAPDPSEIKALKEEIDTLDTRRDRLQHEAEAAREVLEDARERLSDAEGEDEREEALQEAQTMQNRLDTLTGAIDDLTEKIEARTERLDTARAAREQEEEMEALAEAGREAIAAARRVEGLQNDLLRAIREIGADLIEARQEWAEKGKAFRTSAMQKEESIQERYQESDSEIERAEALIEELVSRGVEDFTLATAERLTPDQVRYRGPGNGIENTAKEARLLTRIRTALHNGDLTTSSDQ